VATLRICSWNVNGLRAGLRSGTFPAWLEETAPDIAGLQEVKARPEQVEEARRSVAPQVERQIKRDLVLERLIEDQGLDLSSEEFDERLSELGNARGKSLVEIRRQLAKEKQLDPLRRRFAIDKAFRFLIDGSDVN